MRATSVGYPQLQQHLVYLTRLVAVSQSVDQSGVIGLHLLRVTVHVLHVGLGILEGVCQHRVLSFEMTDLTLEMFRVDQKLLGVFVRSTDTVGYEAFDDFLNTVAVLEGVYQGQLFL